MTKLPIHEVLHNDQADDLIFAHFQTIQPLNEFLKKALQLP